MMDKESKYDKIIELLEELKNEIVVIRKILSPLNPHVVKEYLEAKEVFKFKIEPTIPVKNKDKKFEPWKETPELEPIKEPDIPPSKGPKLPGPKIPGSGQGPKLP